MIHNMIYGGGAGISLRVLSGTELPAAAAENSLWVESDREITSYAFAAREPESPAEGMLWVKLGTDSSSPIDVLSGNSLMLYPRTAQQYLSGAWQAKNAMLYSGGAWRDIWDGHYYRSGELYEAVTGGYETCASDNTAGKNNGLLSFNSNNMVLSPLNTATQGGNLAYSVEAVDVSELESLVFDCKTDGGECSVGVSDRKGVWGGALASKSAGSSRGLVSVDVSGLSGRVYIMLKAWWNASSSMGRLTVYNIYGQ